MINFVQQLMERFKGLDRAYGLYNLNKTREVKRIGTKILGKPSTVVGFVDEELWKKHVDGIVGIGIVPIMDDSRCYFGAIDIDVYSGLDLAKVAKEIKKLDLPLVPCRSKSGGVHCFAFVKEPVPASIMREKLMLFASVLGYGGTEIFPKQVEILADRGDIGQWINMPYFNAEDTDRYGIDIDGSKLSCEAFIREIDKVRMTYLEFNAFTVSMADEIEDGPPCLQHLLTQHFQTGSRNDGLFNLAIYLKKAFPDNWESVLDDYNIRFVDPPLPSSDVLNVVKSIRKKDYNYTCSKAPIKQHCNVSLCRARKYGIGGISGLLQLTGLTKFNSQPPIWFVDVDGGGRMELSTEDLQSQTRFQRRCMETLNMMPPALPTAAWQRSIQTLMENVNIIEASIDSSPKGLLFEYLERFCTSRVQGRSKEEILLGKPWTDDGFHYFRLSDFYAYLERSRFKDFKINQISSMIREYGGESQFIKLKGKGLNIWKIPAFDMQTEDFDEPFIEDKEVM